MNEIIKKALEELGKENPKLDYIRGMLETVLALGGQTVALTSIYTPKPLASFATGSGGHPTATIVDEATILDNMAKEGLKHIVPPTEA